MCWSNGTVQGVKATGTYCAYLEQTLAGIVAVREVDHGFQDARDRHKCFQRTPISHRPRTVVVEQGADERIGRGRSRAGALRLVVQTA